MIAVRPKIRINVNFTHYGLKLLSGGAPKEHDTFGHIETDESETVKPEQRAGRPFRPLKEVKG